MSNVIHDSIALFNFDMWLVQKKKAPLPQLIRCNAKTDYNLVSCVIRALGGLFVF